MQLKLIATTNYEGISFPKPASCCCIVGTSTTVNFTCWSTAGCGARGAAAAVAVAAVRVGMAFALTAGALRNSLLFTDAFEVDRVGDFLFKAFQMSKTIL